MPLTLEASPVGGPGGTIASAARTMPRTGEGQRVDGDAGHPGVTTFRKIGPAATEPAMHRQGRKSWIVDCVLTDLAKNS